MPRSHFGSGLGSGSRHATWQGYCGTIAKPLLSVPGSDAFENRLRRPVLDENQVLIPPVTPPSAPQRPHSHHSKEPKQFITASKRLRDACNEAVAIVAIATTCQSLARGKRVVPTAQEHSFKSRKDLTRCWKQKRAKSRIPVSVTVLPRELRTM